MVALQRLVVADDGGHEIGLVAILLTEQNIRFALGVAERYAVLARGEIVDQGTVEPGADARIADHLAV